MTAFSEADGSKLWSQSFQDLKATVNNPPAYSNGRVFAVAGTQGSTAMFGFDGASGAELFRTLFGASFFKSWFIAPTVFKGAVYTEGGYGSVHSFNALTGAEKYLAYTGVLGPRVGNWSPAFDNTTLYTYFDHRLQMQDPVSGNLPAILGEDYDGSFRYMIQSVPVVGAGGTVYGADNNYGPKNQILALNTVDKSVRWSAKGRYLYNPACGDGYLFAATSFPGKLEARKELDGAVDWSWTPPADDDEAFTSEALVTKNLVFISTRTTTYAIDRSTHLAVWSYKAAGKLALSANGILYIQSSSRIVAINLSDLTKMTMRVKAAGATRATKPAVCSDHPAVSFEECCS